MINLKKLSPIADLRIILKRSKTERMVLNKIQKTNLFWIESGYLHFYTGLVKGEMAARALRILEQWLPMKEAKQLNWRLVEEVFYVDPESKLARFIYSRKTSQPQIKFKSLPGWPVFSVRQIGSQKLGNSRLYARRLQSYKF